MLDLKMGIFEGWVVLVDVDSEVEVYTHAGYDKDDEDFNGLSELPFEKWHAGDLTVIFGNILEDRNYHSMSDIPGNLLSALESAEIPEEKQVEIIRKFAQEFFSR